MNITIVSSVGHDSTLLSAFDQALITAGIHNYNLIPLSSVIPPHSIVEKAEKFEADTKHFGDRLYVVKAETRSDKKGSFLGSGIGWYQLDDGRGFFVEHRGTKNSEKEITAWLTNQIHFSLKDLVMNRGLSFDEKKINIELSTAVVISKPICVLVAAVYKSEGWK